MLLSLTDEEGNALVPGSRAWVMWSNTETDMTPLPCESHEGLRWICGWEEPGSLEIMAGRIGSEGSTIQVDVGSDECHVITEEVDLSLQDASVACTEEVVTSLSLQVKDPDGSPVTGAQVEFTTPWEDWFGPEACMELGDGEYACGEEFVGPMQVSVSATGFENQTESIFVVSDECHAITEDRVLTLEYQ